MRTKLKLVVTIITLIFFSHVAHANSELCAAVLEAPTIEDTATKIQAAVGEWDAGMSGIRGLSKPLAFKVIELANSYSKDPILLAKELRAKIDQSASRNATRAIEDLRIQLLSAKGGLNPEETIAKIQATVGEWDGGMSGIMSLSKPFANAVLELAVSYNLDPLILAKEFRTKIDRSAWRDPAEALEELKLQLQTGSK